MSGLMFPIVWTLIVVVAYLLFRLWVKRNDTKGGDIFLLNIMAEVALLCTAVPTALSLWLAGLLVWSLWFR